MLKKLLLSVAVVGSVAAMQPEQNAQAGANQRGNSRPATPNGVNVDYLHPNFVPKNDDDRAAVVRAQAAREAANAAAQQQAPRAATPVVQPAAQQQVAPDAVNAAAPAAQVAPAAQQQAQPAANAAAPAAQAPAQQQAAAPAATAAAPAAPAATVAKPGYYSRAKTWVSGQSRLKLAAYIAGAAAVVYGVKYAIDARDVQAADEAQETAK